MYARVDKRSNPELGKLQTRKHVHPMVHLLG
jgi:hypothetical protein